VQSAQQARKIYPTRIWLLFYRFCLKMIIMFPYSKNNHNTQRITTILCIMKGQLLSDITDL